MTENISRRSVTQGLAWAVPTVAIAASAPAMAASAPTEGPVDPGDQPGGETGTPLCDCTVNWTTGAVLDMSLADYSNNGYKNIKNDACGYLKLHHWASADRTKLYWRIPFGTTYAIEAGTKLVLSPVSGNWAPVIGSLTTQSGSGLFARFTGITDRFTNFTNGEVNYQIVGDKLVVTLPAMPADSHMLFTVTGATTEPIATTAFEGSVNVQGDYTAESLTALGC